MKALTLALLCAVTAFAALPSATSVAKFDEGEGDHKAAMKVAGPTMGSLRKNLEAKNAEGIAADAAKLESVFKTSEAFWAKRKTDDAVKWSQEALAAAKDLSAAAKANDFDKAAVASKAVGATCMACHTAHREKLPDGGYKIK